MAFSVDWRLNMRIFFVFLTLLSFLVGGTTHAQSDIERQLGAFAGREGAGYAAPEDPRLVVAGIIRTVLTLIGILFVVYTVYAGFLIMTARGEEEKVKKGKDTLRRAVIGVLIVMLAYSFTLFVTQSLQRATSDEGGFEFDARVEDARRGSPSRDPFGGTDGSEFTPEFLR